MRRSSERPAGQVCTALAAEPPPEPWRLRLLIFLGYLASGILVTWPLALHLGDGVIQKGGVPVDAGQGIWNLWWARISLMQGQNPFTTRYLFYPLQVDLFFQTLSLPNALLVTPILLTAGPVAAFNSIALLSFGLGGYFSYRIASALVDDRVAALVAGAVFAFAPYHIQRLWSGPMELIAVHWLPLYVIVLMRVLARPSPIRLFAAALALLITTLASQYYGLYAAVYTVGHGLLATCIAPRHIRLRTLAAVAGVGALWMLGLAPMLLAVGGVGSAVLEDWYVRQVFHSVALIDLIVPNIQHPLWGTAAAGWQQHLHPFGLETGAGVGLVVMILCLIAIARRPRRAWPWAALTLATLVLAMGPQLRLSAADSPVPGPFLLLDLIGPFRNSSRPSVFLALTMVTLAALAAEGVASLRDLRLARLGLTVLLAIELIVAPWPITQISATSAYQMLNHDPIPGAVFELPPRNNDSAYLLNQICHGRPLVGGYLARLPDLPLASYPSALKNLWDSTSPVADILDLNPATELAAIGIRYVTLDLRQLPRFHVMRLRKQLEVPGISQAYADTEIEIYAINPTAGHAVAVLGPGWYASEQQEGRRWRWMRGRAGLSLFAPATAVVRLSLTATAYGEERSLTISQGDQQLLTVKIPSAPYDRPLSLQILLPAGQSDLTLTSPETVSPEGRHISLSIERITVTPLPLAASYQPEQAQLPITIPMLTSSPCTP